MSVTRFCQHVYYSVVLLMNTISVRVGQYPSRQCPVSSRQSTTSIIVPMLLYPVPYLVRQSPRRDQSVNVNSFFILLLLVLCSSVSDRPVSSAPVTVLAHPGHTGLYESTA